MKRIARGVAVLGLVSIVLAGSAASVASAPPTTPTVASRQAALISKGSLLGKLWRMLFGDEEPPPPPPAPDDEKLHIPVGG